MMYDTPYSKLLLHTTATEQRRYSQLSSRVALLRRTTSGEAQGVHIILDLAAYGLVTLDSKSISKHESYQLVELPLDVALTSGSLQLLT